MFFDVLWDRIRNQWQDAVVLLLAVWLLVSPWVLGYAGAATPAWNSYVFAFLIGGFACGALIAWQHWQGWVNALFGLWLVVAPWALDIDNGAAVANLPLVGAAVVVLSVWSATFGRRGDPDALDGRRTP